MRGRPRRRLPFHVLNPFWLEDPIPPRETRSYDGRVDVAIVGGGVTGCSAALRLAEAGLRVRIHDTRAIAEGASGRNGGFALDGGAARYDVARETYGAEHAAAYWRWTEEALDRMLELGGDALRRTGSYRLAADEEEREAITLEYAALREDGFEVEWLDDVPGGAAGRFQGAISRSRGASIQPARFVRRLAARAAAAGAEIREHDTVEDIDALDAERVLVATDGYGHGLVPELADLIWPTRGQVIASEPLDRILYDRPHYARQGFDYWQQLPDGRIVLGGFRDVSILDELTDVEETTPAIQSSLESFLHELAGAEVEVTHRWAGIFGLTQDMLPLVGPVPGRDGRVWVAGGYSGHGNVPGFACGELVADALLGDASSPQLELFDPARFSA
ncbi:MAG TPA: FAD-binding oxidoreductase [Gaiellaceae bacterium]|nr:FAD-binding oxidoreductase [Gaiellaceae bacterium]